MKKAGKTFDLGVYDEAHKTVGQKDKGFAHLLYDKNVKVNNRIFMTATEREFRGDSDEYLSMDNPKIYGTLIDELSFKAALEQVPPLLSDYKVVTSIVTKSDIEKLINKNSTIKLDGTDWNVEGFAATFASLVTLRKLIKERHLKHVVSFHKTIKRPIDFKKLNTGAIKPNPAFGPISKYHVSGKDSTGSRSEELERFIQESPSLVTNARCLTEGLDIPEIDAVLFADPKRSKIDIVQAAGRALRTCESKNLAYIIIPVVLDENAENPSKEAFKQIIQVISALGMNDERIIEEFRAIANKESLGDDRIVIFDVPEIIRVKFSDLISNIELQIWDRLGSGWHKGFNQLKKFVAREGHARVHAEFVDDDNFPLGVWVSTRRQNYKNNKLAADRIAKLQPSKVGYGTLLKQISFMV